jgi:hypothetical protein
VRGRRYGADRPTETIKKKYYGAGRKCFWLRPEITLSD